MAFEENAAPPPSPMQQLLAHAAQSEAAWKYGVLLAALLCLIVFVIRPMVRKGTAGERALALAAQEPRLAQAAEQSALAGAENESNLVEKRRAQAIFDAVSEHLRTEPAQATRLLQSWIHTE
jgi:flagellar M-ring protein FliF